MPEGGRVSDGQVIRGTVIQVLMAHNVYVVPYGEEPDCYLLAKDGKLLVAYLDSYVLRNTLRLLERSFKIPIYLFFNPELPPASRIQ